MIAIQKFDPKDFDRFRVWDDRYRQLYASQGDFTEYKKQSFWPLLEQKLIKTGNYLDAGCGIGGWILFLTDLGYGVEGIDAHPQAVRSMTEYDPDLSVKIAGSDAIPYTNDTFEGVISIGSLEYNEGLVEKSIEEFYRVLKPGGFVCIEVPLANTLRTLFYIPLKKLEYIFMSTTDRKPTFAYYLFDRFGFEELLKKSGFTVEEVLPHDLPDEDSHFGLYANWPILRGEKPYELNVFGRILKAACNAISPWIASAGVVVIATKQSSRRPQ